MTREQLDEIEKLAEAATPGPYQVVSMYPAYGVFRVQVDEPSECVAMCAVSMNEDADEAHVERQEAHARNGANARAIAALLKYALPLVKALRERDEGCFKSMEAHRLDVEACRRRMGDLLDHLAREEAAAHQFQKERDEARAEVERLREAINGALTNGHMNALCWAQNDDECVGRCRVLRDALKEGK